MNRKRLVPASRGQLDEKSRVFAYEFGVLLCELLPRYQSVFQSDFAKVLIVHAIGVASVSRLMARPEAADFESLTTYVPADLQVPVNALSIAESTGIPRETVRRKIKEMIADGILVEDERGGYRMKPGTLQGDQVLDLYYQQLLTLTTLLNRCVEAGIITVEDT
ncbi:MAG: HTH domain-containing protein [Sphingomonadales bacterium]